MDWKSNGIVFYINLVVNHFHSMIFNVLILMIHLVQHNIWLVYYYNLDMLNVAINRHFYSGGVKSVVCSPGLVLTRTSPAALRYGELILCFMEYLNIIL